VFLFVEVSRDNGQVLRRLSGPVKVLAAKAAALAARFFFLLGREVARIAQAGSGRAPSCDLGIHADRAGGINFLDVNSYIAIQKGHVDGLFSSLGELFEQWPGELVEPEAINETACQPEELQAQAIVSGFAVLGDVSFPGQVCSRRCCLGQAALRAISERGRPSWPSARTSMSCSPRDRARVLELGEAKVVPYSEMMFQILLYRYHIPK
jgi:hypothetical protein